MLTEPVTMSTGPRGRTNATLDELLRVLSNGPRRRLLQYLSQRPDEPVTVEELCNALLDDERLDEPATARIETTLHHVHIPALADVGVVAVEDDRSVVRYEEEPRVETLLEAIETIA